MPNVELYINPNQYQSGYYDVIVNGSGFHQYVNRDVGGRLMGDDQWFDDYLGSLGIPGLDRVGHDGSFTLYNRVHGNTLNEDWGRDEIYAVVGVDGGGEFKTNTVRRSF